MIAALIRWSARNVFLVGFATIFVALAGIYAVSRVPLDAIPDLSDVQVIVYTEYSGQAPQVVEDQVTYPLTTAMLSVPKSRVVRGFSFFGVSFVYVIFGANFLSAEIAKLVRHEAAYREYGAFNAGALLIITFPNSHGQVSRLPNHGRSFAAPEPSTQPGQTLGDQSPPMQPPNTGSGEVSSRLSIVIANTVEELLPNYVVRGFETSSPTGRHRLTPRPS
jgi:hypothetical protein